MNIPKKTHLAQYYEPPQGSGIQSATTCSHKLQEAATTKEMQIPKAST